MATETKNYKFHKPEMNDYADVTVLGETIDQIDTELKNVQKGAVKTDLSNFDATKVNGCYIKHDTTGKLFRIGVDSDGLYMTEVE